MGMCKPSGGIKKIYIKFGRNIPKANGTPNTRTDAYNIDNPDELLQQRWYGPDGMNLWYRDWSHGGGEHEWSHDHYVSWDNSKNPRPPYNGPNGEKTNLNYC